MTPLRYLDLVVLVMALPVFIGADLPLGGYAAGAAAWVAQRSLQVVLARRARTTENPRQLAAIAFASMIGRTLFVAAAIVAAGTAERRAGLAAAVLMAVVFTVYFATSLVLGPGDSRGRTTS